MGMKLLMGTIWLDFHSISYPILAADNYLICYKVNVGTSSKI